MFGTRAAIRHRSGRERRHLRQSSGNPTAGSHHAAAPRRQVGSPSPWIRAGVRRPREPPGRAPGGPPAAAASSFAQSSGARRAAPGKPSRPLDRGSSSDTLTNRKTIGITRSSGSATQGAARTAEGSRCAAAQLASVSARSARRWDRGPAASGRVASRRWRIRCVTPICAGATSSVGPGSFALAMSAARPLQDLRRGPGEPSRAGRTGRRRDE